MKREAQVAAKVRAGFLRDQPRAVETVRGWIAAMVFGAGWGLEDPEGAIQEVTLRILHLGRAGRIRDDTDFKSFVLTVARHECTDIYRRERLRTVVETGGAEMGPVSAPAPASQETPHQRLEEKERREILRFIFQGLSEECRRLYRWLYRDGFTAAEVAVRLGITSVNARVRAHRCLTKAREIRKEYFLGAGALDGAGRHG